MNKYCAYCFRYVERIEENEKGGLCRSYYCRFYSNKNKKPNDTCEMWQSRDLKDIIDDLTQIASDIESLSSDLSQYKNAHDDICDAMNLIDEGLLKLNNFIEEWSNQEEGQDA